MTETELTTEGQAKIIYILYLAGFVVPFTGVIGVVMAYINRSDAPDWLRAHYQFQIRTFWIGFLYVIIGFFTTFILIGFLILLFYLIWLIVRCVKGMKMLDLKREPENVTGWLF